MALDAGIRSGVRSWVGSDPTDPTDSDIEAAHARLGSAEAVALEVLRGRLANMVREPARFTVDGDAGWSYERNLAELRTQIGQLEGLVATAAGTGEGVMVVGRMLRSGRER